MSDAVRTLNCPNCGGTISIKAAGYSLTVACQYCGSELDAAGPELSLIKAYHEAVAPLELPLGSRATLRGVEWEVVGYQERSDDEVSWSEYLLFNPYAGYRWLIRSDGEWTFGTPVTTVPTEAGGNAVKFRGARYHSHYDPVATTTNRIVGEFYWRARRGDRVQATMFESGGGSLSYELGGDEVNWTFIEPLPNDGSIERGFLGEPSPTEKPRSPGSFGRKRVAPAFQPAPTVTSTRRRPSDADDAATMIKLALATLAVLFLMTIFLNGTGSAAENEITLQTGAPAQNITLATLNITRPYQMITVTARGDEFVNKWVDLDYSLVDRRTQQSIDAYGLMEYYAGQDSDGPWTEGSHVTRAKFAGIPRGTYDLVVEASATQWTNPSAYNDTAGATYLEPVTIKFSVAPGGMFFSNFLLFAALTIAPAAFALYRLSQRGYDG